MQINSGETHTQSIFIISATVTMSYFAYSSIVNLLLLLLVCESVVMGASRFRSETQRMTVVEGQRMDLVCQSDLEAKSCAFKPPFGTAFAVLATEEDVRYQKLCE